jgi:DNA-binding Lrp family transcriptional regulator
MEKAKPQDVKPVTLDATDLRLLALLQRDAGLANQDLASMAHVSPATCLRRVRRLTDLGVIRARVALLDADRIGPSIQVVCEVTLDRQGQEHVEAFERLAVAHPAVRQCYRVSPGPDLVILAMANDMAAWSGVVAELFTQHANVRNVKTFFVLHRAKFDTAVVLPVGLPVHSTPVDALR